MKTARLKSHWSLFGVFGVVVLLDQMSKWWASTQGLSATNTGISLGLGNQLQTEFLTGIIVLVLVGLGWSLREVWRRQPLAAGLILGGGFSNILDRVWWGGVRDWLLIPGTETLNNVADWAIALGVVILGIQWLAQARRPQRSHHQEML